MKLVLNDKTEIAISSVNDNYNTKIVSDEEKHSVTFTISNPDENITINYLATLFTDENVSGAQIVSEGLSKTIDACRISNIMENISDGSHIFTIRASYI